MKIIGIDNFGRENVADILVAENVPEYYAKELHEFVSKTFGGEYANYYYELKPDDYKLWRGMEELV